MVNADSEHPVMVYRIQVTTKKVISQMKHMIFNIIQKPAGMICTFVKARAFSHFYDFFLKKTQTIDFQ